MIKISSRAKHLTTVRWFAAMPLMLFLLAGCHVPGATVEELGILMEMDDEARMHVSHLEAHEEDGNLHVVGNITLVRHWRPRVWLEVVSVSGEQLGTVDATVPGLNPGGRHPLSARFYATVDGVPPRGSTVTVHADPKMTRY